jgi:hypothetical protein
LILTISSGQWSGGPLTNFQLLGANDLLIGEYIFEHAEDAATQPNHPDGNGKPYIQDTVNTVNGIIIIQEGETITKLRLVNNYADNLKISSFNVFISINNSNNSNNPPFTFIQYLYTDDPFVIGMNNQTPRIDFIL